jgi:transcriptional regulator with XRE-family HTH domain
MARSFRCRTMLSELAQRFTVRHQQDGESRILAKKPQRKKSDRMASKGHPNPVDVHVGARIRLRRTMMGLSQSTLGEQLGLTFQQVQKYERGTNRVSSSRLFDLTRILNVPIAYFYDEMNGDIAKQSPGKLQGKAPTKLELNLDPAAKRETLELVRAYYRIPDQQVRQKLTNIIRAIAAGE